jgi:transglutaminase-like putative cysteine protease
VTRHAQRMLSVALLLSVALFTLESLQWIAGGVLLSFWLVTLTPLKVSPDRILQLALGLVAIAVSWLLAVVAELPVNARLSVVLGPIGRFAALGLLLTALWRSAFREPWGGVRGSAALVLLALLFLADGQFDLSFIVIALGVLLCLWRALWAADPTRTAWRQMDARLRLLTGLTCTLAALVAGTTAVAIPAVYPWLARIVLDVLDDRGPSTGFGSSLALGALSGLRDNDARVLRVHGRYVEHLRGIAYDEYRRGRWTQVTPAKLRTVRLAGASATGAAQTEIETVGGDGERYFLPLHAAAVQVSGGLARVDPTGNLQVMRDTRAERIAFRSGARDRLEPAPPGPRDLVVPAALEPELRRLAGAWSVGVRGSVAQLAALEARLRRHNQYALEFERSPGLDPVLDFLTVHRQGHCEYFASALALLGRSLGIPTRVVGGYRVSEHNDFGGYYLVREQHAHAWVEAWHPELGWQTHDPTPTSGMVGAGQHTPFFASVIDSVGQALSRVGGQLGAGQLYAGAALLFVAWMAMRALRALRNRTARRVGGAAMRVPPALDRLLQALARRGYAREAHEPLERYALRVGEAPELQACGGVLRSYTAYRYGGRGDAAQIDAALQREAEALARRTI